MHQSFMTNKITLSILTRRKTKEENDLSLKISKNFIVALTIQIFDLNVECLYEFLVTKVYTTEALFSKVRLKFQNFSKVSKRFAFF